MKDLIGSIISLDGGFPLTGPSTGPFATGWSEWHATAAEALAEAHKNAVHRAKQATARCLRKAAQAKALIAALNKLSDEEVELIREVKHDAFERMRENKRWRGAWE